MSTIEALVRGFISKEFGSGARQDDYVSIDGSGRAHFDVASFLVSEEGQRRVNEIAQSNRALRAEGTSEDDSPAF